MNPDPNGSDSLVKGVISGDREKVTMSPEETAKWYSRKFVREGPLTLYVVEKRTAKDYYFFLFNDVLWA